MGHSVSMIDVGGKPVTRRTARAHGTIHGLTTTIQLVREGKLKKGNALGLAEAAALYAAKRTPDLLALCHPIELDSTDVSFAIHDTSVEVSVECVAHGKTGVEMEALTACTVALLTLFDLMKAHDEALRISDVRVVEKTGGMSTSLAPVSFSALPAVVITMSDRVSQGTAADRSGPLLVEYLLSRGANVSAHPQLVADDQQLIVDKLRRAKDAGAKLILCTGGTGLGPRDVTPEALRQFMTLHQGKEVEGFGERLRFVGSQHKRSANLSRQLAILCEGCLIVALPGSDRAVTESLTVLDELLPHALHIAAGKDHS